MIGVGGILASMSRRLFSRTVLAAGAILASGWGASGGSAALQNAHCAPLDGHPAAHESHRPPHAVLGTRDCSHCVMGDCPVARHCSVGTLLALVSVPPVFAAPAIWPAHGSWLPDRLLSANPTPPNPPPQATL